MPTPGPVPQHEVTGRAAPLAVSPESLSPAVDPPIRGGALQTPSFPSREFDYRLVSTGGFAVV